MKFCKNLPWNLTGPVVAICLLVFGTYVWHENKLYSTLDSFAFVFFRLESEQCIENKTICVEQTFESSQERKKLSMREMQTKIHWERWSEKTHVKQRIKNKRQTEYFICHLCGHRLDSRVKNNLLQHMNGRQLFSTQNMQLSIDVYKDAITRHIRIHTSRAKPFKCVNCKKMFTVWNSWRHEKQVFCV